VGDGVSRLLVLVQAWPRYIERAVYLDQTLKALREHLDTGSFEPAFVVSSESRGCDTEAVFAQERACQEHGFTLRWRAGRPSVGQHLNDALAVDDDWSHVFYCQEDHQAIREVRLGDGLIAMERTRALLARYMVSGKQLAEPRPVRDMAEWYSIDPGCYAYHYAHNPYLARREFFERMGPFAERQSENTANLRAQYLWLHFALRLPSSFRHIGEVPAMTEKHAARAAARAER
jgi:hypothetical protein